MKSELQDKFVDILSSIQANISKGSDFVLTQLPDVAQQYIAFGRAWCFVDIAMMCALLYVCYQLCKYAITSEKTDCYDEWVDRRIASICVGGIGGIISFFLIAHSMRDAFLVWFAPKVWILMELANLMSHQ